MTYAMCHICPIYIPYICQENWDKELRDMRDNLAKEGISWEDKKENFISVKGTAQANRY